MSEAEEIMRRNLAGEGQPASGGEGQADGGDASPRINAGGPFVEVTKAAWRALQGANDPPRFFRRGGVPVRVSRSDTGQPVIERLDLDRMRHHVARVADWVRYDKHGQPYDSKPPVENVKDVLAAPDPALPVLTSVVSAPVFAPDGSIITTPGYHAGGQVWYESDGITVPPVPPDPSDAEVATAREMLCEPLADFPFVSDSDRAHAVAFGILPFARALIPGRAPLHLFEKPQWGTGATLLVEILATLILGPVRTLPAFTEARNEEEWRKRIVAKLMDGTPVVLIDNLRRKLDSPALSSAITSVTYEDRRLGRNDEMLRVPVRCAWAATANNPQLSGEIARRSVSIRLDADSEKPWLDRTFRHPDLRGWVGEHLGELRHAALVLVQAWLARGRPSEGVPVLGMFEEWSRTIGGVLSVAGFEGFLGNLDELYEEATEEDRGLGAFVDAWWSRFGDAEKQAGDLFELADEHLELGSGSEKARRNRLAYLLRDNRGRRFGSLKLIRAHKFGGRRGATTWRLVQR